MENEKVTNSAPAAAATTSERPSGDRPQRDNRDRGDRAPRDNRRGGGGGGQRRGRRKVCAFCVDRADHIDYKDISKLRRFMTERAKIMPRRMTGTCAHHQRMLTVAIKRARQVALLPFVND